MSVSDDTIKKFIAAIAPTAIASARDTHIPPGFVVAEAALESTWGTSALAIQARNLFGVKADKSWHGDVWDHPTREFLNGEWVMRPARWRKYPDWRGSIGDHAAFLRSNQRYSAAFQAVGSIAFTRAIAAAGYATDPKYADKIIAVIRGRNLLALDDQVLHPV